jgi:hypothetical protein
MNDSLFKVRTSNNDNFCSFSCAATPEGKAEIGIALCIDLQKYRRYLAANGALR